MEHWSETRRVSFLVLRAFFAQFWLLQAFTKLRDQESGIVALRNLGIWAGHLTEWFVKATPLPAALVRPYALAVPWVETSIGLLLLLGLWMRPALIASAAFLVSLCLGLMLQSKHEVVATNMVFLLATLVALGCEPDGRGWSIDALLLRRLSPAVGAGRAAGVSPPSGP